MKTSMEGDDCKYSVFRVRLAFVSVLVGLVSLLTYGPILSYSFAASDTLTLIETGQIGSLKDLGTLFTYPVMTGSSFGGNYWRPLSSFSFSVDYWLWGLDPNGYNLTNLILHSLVSGLFVLLVYRIARGSVLVAGLAGAIFALHPTLNAARTRIHRGSFEPKERLVYMVKKMTMVEAATSWPKPDQD